MTKLKSCTVLDGPWSSWTPHMTEIEKETAATDQNYKQSDGKTTVYKMKMNAKSKELFELITENKSCDINWVFGKDLDPSNDCMRRIETEKKGLCFLPQDANHLKKQISQRDSSPLYVLDLRGITVINESLINAINEIQKGYIDSVDVHHIQAPSRIWCIYNNVPDVVPKHYNWFNANLFDCTKPSYAKSAE